MSVVPFPFAKDRLVGLSWQDLLDRATSEAEVVAVARDFLAGLEPVDLARLPPTCFPPKLFSADEVSSYALTLARRHTESYDESMGPLLSRMAAFFLHANIRLAQLLTKTNDASEDVERSA